MEHGYLHRAAELVLCGITRMLYQRLWTLRVTSHFPVVFQWESKQECTKILGRTTRRKIIQKWVVGRFINGKKEGNLWRKAKGHKYAEVHISEIGAGHPRLGSYSNILEEYHRRLCMLQSVCSRTIVYMRRHIWKWAIVFNMSHVEQSTTVLSVAKAWWNSLNWIRW